MVGMSYKPDNLGLITLQFCKLDVLDDKKIRKEDNKMTRKLDNKRKRERVQVDRGDAESAERERVVEKFG